MDKVNVYDENGNHLEVLTGTPLINGVIVEYGIYMAATANNLLVSASESPTSGPDFKQGFVSVYGIPVAAPIITEPVITLGVVIPGGGSETYRV